MKKPISPRPALATPRAAALLRWFDSHARTLPWRVLKGRTANSYHVAVSEFMLQQTGVATVIPYFMRFIARWPDFKALAAAELDAVRAAWAGLGYYRRAAFLHALAREVTEKHAGRLPRTEQELRALPGLGPYAAAAVAAIAFGQRVPVVDGNVVRLLARVFMLEARGSRLREDVRIRLAPLIPNVRAGDFAQGVMELGALICTPRAPKCPSCPWRTNCRAYAAGRQALYPRKDAAKATPQKQAHIFVLTAGKDRVLMRKRAEIGLLAGLWEFPSTPWAAAPLIRAAALRPGGKKIAWREGPSAVTHVFSHFKLHLTLQLGHSPTIFSLQDSSYRWMKREELSTIALPTIMRKVADAAFRSDAPFD